VCPSRRHRRPVSTKPYLHTPPPRCRRRCRRCRRAGPPPAPRCCHCHCPYTTDEQARMEPSVLLHHALEQLSSPRCGMGELVSSPQDFCCSRSQHLQKGRGTLAQAPVRVSAERHSPAGSHHCDIRGIASQGTGETIDRTQRTEEVYQGPLRELRGRGGHLSWSLSLRLRRDVCGHSRCLDAALPEWGPSETRFPWYF